MSKTRRSFDPEFKMQVSPGSIVIMKELNLLQDQITPKASNYKKSQKHELTGPNQLWEMDMTQWYLDEPRF